MNSQLLPARKIARRSQRGSSPAESTAQLTWIHDGVRHRVLLHPDVSFERETVSGQWVAAELSEDACASAALGVTARQWRQASGYLPATCRELLERFELGRMAALQVVTRCPSLIELLTATPALIPFLHGHLGLRGGDTPRWSEIAAVFEREGIFGLLQWLGLPASRQTIAILQNIADPDLPRRLLEPLRSALWEPEAIWALSHAPELTDEDLARTCSALAA
jgi:hypothetical protein